MNGLAITAGSKPIFLANSGRVQPTSFAKNTVHTRVMHTTAAIGSTASFKIIIFAKFALASTTPHKRDTLISFQIVLKMSEKSISSSEIPRIMVTDA